MTSAISTTELKSLATASAGNPISSEMLAEAAATQKDPAAAQELLQRDLRDIIKTKSLGDNTPKVTDELQTKLDSLAPSSELRPINSLASALWTASNTRKEEGAPFDNAYSLRALAVGVRTAMQAQLAETTEEQKSAKEALIGIIEDLPTAPSMSLVTSLWGALAEPTEGGAFQFPAAVLQSIPTALGQQSKLLSGVNREFVGKALSALSEAVKDGGTEAANTDAPKAEKSAGFPTTIAGLDKAALEAITKKAYGDARVGEFLYSVRNMRPAWYRELIEKVRSNPACALIEPAALRYLKNVEDQQREIETTFQGRELDKNSLAGNTDKQLGAIYTAIREVADELGAGPDLSVVRIPALAPNAYVYISNFDAPRVVVHDSTARMCWNSETNDWITVGLDKKGEVVPLGTPDSEAFPIGKYVFQGVCGHELTHIRDGITLNRVILGVLTGYGLDDEDSLKTSNHVHSAACGCNFDGGAESSLLQKAMASPEFKSLLPAGGVSKDLGELNKRFADLLGADLLAKAGGVSGIMSQLTREAEITADHGGSSYLGDPKPLAMFFDMIRRASDTGTSKERENVMVESYKRDIVGEARAGILRAQNGAFRGQAALGAASSHPPEAFRAVENDDFANEEGGLFQRIQAFKDLPPAQRLIASALAVDSGIERLDDNLDAFKQSLAAQTSKTFESVAVGAKKNALLERLSIITTQLSDLAFKDGLRIVGDEPKGFIIDLVAFARNEGAKLFPQDASSGGVAAGLLAALGGGRGGGGGASEAQGVNMFGQLASQLTAKVDEAGDTLSPADKALWGEAIGALKKLAAEGHEELGAARQSKRREERATRRIAARAANRLI